MWRLANVSCSAAAREVGLKVLRHDGADIFWNWGVREGDNIEVLKSPAVIHTQHFTSHFCIKGCNGCPIPIFLQRSSIRLNDTPKRMNKYLAVMQEDGRDPMTQKLQTVRAVVVHHNAAHLRDKHSSPPRLILTPGMHIL